MKLPISQAQKLEYAYNCQIRIENTIKFQNCQNIVCEYNRTDIAGENLRKIQSGSVSYFETSLFLCMPILHLKGYQPDSFFCGFPKVSTVQTQFQAFIFKNERERSHCVSGQVGALRVSFALQSKAAIVSPGVIEKPGFTSTSPEEQRSRIRVRLKAMRIGHLGHPEQRVKGGFWGR